LAKRLSKLQKEQILEDYRKGKSLDFLSQKFGFTKITISRNIKKILSLDKLDKNENINISLDNKSNESKRDRLFNEDKKNIEDINDKIHDKRIDIANNQFYEIAPIEHNIDENSQKDLSSLPIKSVELPKVVYMIVDKQIDLCIKSLRDYPDWNFLPDEDLNRLTLEIFSDQKYAKQACTKNQKLIKVPNPNVFLIASKPLKKKGISRIIFDKLLLSL